MGDLVPGLEVETLGLNVTVLLTPGDLLELVGAGGMRGLVSMLAGMMSGLTDNVKMVLKVCSLYRGVM